MNWSGVRNFLIAILIAANLFLLYNILRQNMTRSFLSGDEIGTAAALLSERGLRVDEDTVPARRFSSDVFESRYSEAYFADAASALCGSERESLAMQPDGSNLILMKNGSEVLFGSGFVFRWYRSSNSEDSAYTDIEPENFAAARTLGTEIGTAKMKTLSALAEGFFNCRLENESALAAEIMDGFTDTRTGFSYLLARQTISGYPVFGHSAVCAFDGETLVYAAGVWYFADVNGSYDCELYDQVNILFTDLSEMTEEIQNGGSPEVESISACYAVYWNTERTAINFVPAWQIEHKGADTIVYNAANNTRYLRTEKKPA